MTFVVENHHYYAWCRDCPYTGPLRFRRTLAADDAVAHLVDKHGVTDDGDVAIESATSERTAGA
jgi:hypothetical protein